MENVTIACCEEVCQFQTNVGQTHGQTSRDIREVSNNLWISLEQTDLAGIRSTSLVTFCCLAVSNTWTATNWFDAALVRKDQNLD